MPFTLLRSHTVPRPLPIALAHSFAACKLGNTERMTLLNRTYLRMTPLEQLQCRAELHQCKLAMRGHMLADIKG